jgi:fermentation-respiration switch protein FrsA (DUF1100 family)
MGGLVSSVVVGWLLINGFMFLAQPGMLFYPTSRLDARPSDWGMHYRDVAMRAEDGVALHGWFIPSAESDLALLFFHGNAGNISHRGDSVGVFRRLGVNVLIPDYRGYGRSEGSPSEEGLYRDARAAWQWLVDEGGFPPQRIIVFGRSLGGVVAARLASEVGPRALILESTFTSARDMARDLFPVLSRLVWLRYDLDAASYVRGVRAPTLVMHSPQDEIIPYRLGRAVFEAAPQPKRFIDLNGGHNDGFLRSEPGYTDALRGFLAGLPGGAGGGPAMP